ncbi:MAG: excinuclease ABC subunit UvrC [Planctomycetes bacterium]|nr:excinuclease ABC subunit UvrC [Planctomycetota bacterium]
MAAKKPNTRPRKSSSRRRRSRQAVLDVLRDKVSNLSTAAGVYVFKDAADVVLYVGKAKSLRARVASYFQEGADLHASRGPEIARMIAQLVSDVDVLECDSEVDALLQESRLIKDIQPPFNARQKDDKSFPYLQITTREDFPRVSITRRPKTKNATLYGPFVSVSDLRAALPLMQRVFKFRTCNLDIDADEARSGFRPCILHNIRQCTAPCAGLVSKSDYAKQIKHLKQFLASKGSQLRRDLAREMQAAAGALDFERAAAVRDELKALEGLQQRGLVHEHAQPEVFYVNPAEGLERLAKALDLPAAPRTIEGIDIAHLQGRESCGSMVCFIDGRPFKSAYRRYKIKTVEGNDDYASIREVVYRRYKYAGMDNELFPDVILIDGGKGQLKAAYSAFDELAFTPPMLISLAKQEEEIFVHGRSGALRLRRNDPALRLLQSVRDESHRFAQHYHHILRRRVTLEQQGPVRNKRTSSDSAPS